MKRVLHTESENGCKKLARMAGDGNEEQHHELSTSKMLFYVYFLRSLYVTCTRHIGKTLSRQYYSTIIDRTCLSFLSKYFKIPALFTAQISGNMDFVICIIPKKWDLISILMC